MARLKELRGELRTKREKLATYFEKTGDGGRPVMTAEQRDEVRGLHNEINALQTEYDGLRETATIEKKNKSALADMNKVRVPGSFEGRQVRYKGRVHLPGGYVGGDGASLIEGTIGHRFISAKGYTSTSNKGGGREWGVKFPELETKTLFQTTAGFDPFVPRQPFIALSPQQQPRIVDLLPTSETTFHSIKWMLETLYTNAADSTAEGALYPEAAIQFTEQLSPVQKIAVFLPATDEQLEDAPRTRDLLNNRLTLMLRQKLDQLLANGNGTAPNLKGLLSITNRLTQALGADAAPSAIYKAMTKIRFTAFAEPSGVIMNPSDWQGIKLLQTADGLYIWGHPSEETVNRIWGLPVVVTTYMPQSHAIVADFLNHTELIWRKGMEFLVSNSHADFFQRGQLAIRADMRAAFICTRETAVCEVTGLVADV
jgi:hypothetical protein